MTELPPLHARVDVKEGFPLPCALPRDSLVCDWPRREAPHGADSP